MMAQESPIHDYYTLDFKHDLNGKQQEWEAVVRPSSLRSGC